MAARRVHRLWLSAHTPLPTAASAVSAVELTVKAVARAGGAAPSRATAPVRTSTSRTVLRRACATRSPSVPTLSGRRGGRQSALPARHLESDRGVARGRDVARVVRDDRLRRLEPVLLGEELERLPAELDLH